MKKNVIVLAEAAADIEYGIDFYDAIEAALQCRHCGFGLLGPGHLDALRVATHDGYRRR